MKAVIYRDLKDENKHGYELIERSDDEEIVVVSEQVIPGLHGYKSLHITHLNKDRNFFVIAQTDYELSISKRKSIMRGAIAFFNQHNSSN